MCGVYSIHDYGGDEKGCFTKRSYWGPTSRPRSACRGQCLNDLNSEQECRRRVCSPVSFGQLLGLSTGRTDNVPGDAATALKSTQLHVEPKACVLAQYRL